MIFFKRMITLPSFTLLLSMSLSFIGPWAFAVGTEKQRSLTLACTRKFSDEQIRQRLLGTLPVGAAGGVSVRYEHCSYRVLMWPAGHPVDSDVFVELDAEGNLPPEVVKYGWHCDQHEEVNLRKAPVPPYPARALAEKITGSIVVRGTVTPDSLDRDSAGWPEARMTAAHVVQISPPEAHALTEGLIDASKNWRFNPRMRYGTALPSDVMLRFRFSMDRKHAGSDDKPEVPDDVAWLETLEIER